MALTLFLLSLFYYIYGQEINHCINELQAITQPTDLILSNSSGIKPNYSSISSVAYHYDTSTLLFAGDFFYIDPKNTNNRNYYQYFQAFTHTTDNKLNMKYSKNISFTNPSFGNQLITHESLRSWTRIIAHPSLPYIFLLGINNLTAYNVTDGTHLWTAQMTPCALDPKKTNNPNRPIIYNDATFFKQEDDDNIYVGGTCISTWNKTVIVLDKYNVKTGEFDKTFRLQYNLTDVGFFDLESHPKVLDILNGAGFIPPEVTIKAPVDALNTSIEDKYFYIGFTHLMFSGICRIEYDVIAKDWRVKKWPDHWTLVNPSFVSHRNLVTTNDGLISLLDPSLNGLLSLFLGHMKHLMGWETVKKLGQIDEKEIFDTSTWYGGHQKHDLHLDWTLNIDPSDYQHIYVTTAPLQFTTNASLFRNSTIAKHDVNIGDIKAGAHVPFHAIDSIVTNHGQLVTVGFKWTPNMKSESESLNTPSLNGILPYLERTAVYQIFNNTETKETCIGCEVDYYNNKSLGKDGLCINKCECKNGYCNDDLEGDGTCYCTLLSYGPTCYPCDGTKGPNDEHSCEPTKGICNSGPTGDGLCKFCYNLELEPNISIGMDKYGPHCNYDCTCDGDHGICFTSGDIENPRAGECLYCTDNNYYGANCDKACDCDTNKGYCDHGVNGTGCIAFDYGGLLKNKGWEFYTIIGSCLWIFFFTITFWQTNKHHKQKHGTSLPWCPSKEKNENNNDNHPDNNKDNDVWNENGPNDLNEKMLNGNGYHRGQQDDNYLLDEDSNEPPAISHMINDGNGVIEQQNDQNERYNI